MNSLTQPIDRSPVTPASVHAGFYRWSDGPSLGYLVLRLMIGMNFLMHGLTRVVDPHKFAGYIQDLFKDTILPRAMLTPFGYGLPWVELFIGLLLLPGLFTRFAATLGGLTMVALTFGTTLRQDWSGAGGQLLYSIVFYLLLTNIERNVISVDRLLKRNR